MNRRDFLRFGGTGLGGIALTVLLAEQGLLAQDKSPIRPQWSAQGPSAPRPPHFAAKAKNVLVIFCSGALSHLDVWDYKPELIKRHGQPLPDSKDLVTFQGANGALTQLIIEELVDDVVSVSDARIEAAIGVYLEVGKLVAEGAGAAGLAAILDDPGRFRGRNVVTILSGANLDLHLLTQVVMRRLTRSGRLVHLVLQLPDRPGTLAAVTALVAAHGANVVSVAHDRFRPELALRAAELELTVDTRDAAHRDELVAAVEAAGYPVLRTEPGAVAPAEGG